MKYDVSSTFDTCLHLRTKIDLYIKYNVLDTHVRLFTYLSAVYIHLHTYSHLHARGANSDTI